MLLLGFHRVRCATVAASLTRVGAALNFTFVQHAVSDVTKIELWMPNNDVQMASQSGNFLLRLNIEAYIMFESELL
jgi:hypothetical protein